MTTRAVSIERKVNKAGRRGERSRWTVGPRDDTMGVMRDDCVPKLSVCKKYI